MGADGMDAVVVGGPMPPLSSLGRGRRRAANVQVVLLCYRGCIAREQETPKATDSTNERIAADLSDEATPREAQRIFTDLLPSKEPARIREMRCHDDPNLALRAAWQVLLRE